MRYKHSLTYCHVIITVKAWKIILEAEHEPRKSKESKQSWERSSLMGWSGKWNLLSRKRESISAQAELSPRNSCLQFCLPLPFLGWCWAWVNTSVAWWLQAHSMHGCQQPAHTAPGSRCWRRLCSWRKHIWVSPQYLCQNIKLSCSKHTSSPELDPCQLAASEAS